MNIYNIRTHGTCPSAWKCSEAAASTREWRASCSPLSRWTVRSHKGSTCSPGPARPSSAPHSMAGCRVHRKQN